MRAMGRISSLATCVDAESGRESPGRARGNPGSVAASGVSSHPACGRRPLPARWWLLRVQRCRSTGGPTMKTLIDLLAWCVLFVMCWPLALLALVLRSDEHTYEIQSLMRISYAVFCLKKKN